MTRASNTSSGGNGGNGASVFRSRRRAIVIAPMQALTQVQEVTLTFIPKIIAIFLVAMLTAPFIGSVLFGFTEQVYARIEQGF